MNIMKKLHLINEKLEHSRWLGWGILILYIVCLCLISYYHEPWHDEAQAWLIARDDSLWHLITHTTHYEGHPPLWHFMLMLPAKLGVPFELGLKAVNIFFCSLAVWLVTVKSPLPWYFRVGIPFSFFYFYQFGVINRCYSLLMAATMAAAYFYPRRQTKPLYLALSLAAMAATQAYGMMLACGIALAWLWEIVADLRQDTGRTQLSFWRRFWQHPGIRALLVLLVISVACGLMILPRSDTAFMRVVAKVNHLASALYVLLLIPGQVLCNNNFQDNFKDGSLTFFAKNVDTYCQMYPQLGIYAVLMLLSFLLSYSYGFAALLFLGYVCWRTGKLKLFLLPLFFYDLMAANLYWVNYHAGILAIFLVFILWQLCQDQPGLDHLQDHLQKQFSFSWGYAVAKTVFYVALLIIFFLNAFWSFRAAQAEIQYPFDISRELALYIKEQHLQNNTFWVKPDLERSSSGKIIIGSYAVNGYFSKNMIQDKDGGFLPDRGYHEYRLQEKPQVIAKLKSFGPPDFVLASEDKKDLDFVQEIFDRPITYLPVKTFTGYRIWKTYHLKGTVVLYARQDVAAKLHLPVVE